MSKGGIMVRVPKVVLDETNAIMREMNIQPNQRGAKKQSFEALVNYARTGREMERIYHNVMPEFLKGKYSKRRN